MERETYGYYLQYQTIPEALAALHADNDRVAVICGEESITYRELIAEAQELALALRAEGVKKGERIILALDRSVSFITALVAVLYAGASYVAADSSWPQERLEYIRKDSSARFLLDAPKLQMLCEKKAEGSLPILRGEDEFAVYYTSGSTGVPRGCVTHHRVRYHFTMPLRQNVHSYETMMCCECILSLGNFAYDAVGHDVFLSLLCGKRLILATEEERLNPKLLGERMRSERVDALTATPSQLLSYASEDSFREAARQVKRFVLLGEPLTQRIVEQVAVLSDGCIINNYGSSEISETAAARIVPGGEIHIGSPVYGAELFLLDAGGRQVPDGEAGELCVGGVPAALSYYLGNSALTAEKYTHSEGLGRIYHTGDQGVRNPDGTISILGRLDSMKKLHGQRIELREVERCLESFPGIQRAAADIRGEEPDSALFCWYLATQPLEEDEIRAYLMEKLPVYMIPQRMQQVQSFPQNSNGKLDRCALPEIEAGTEPFAPPETRLEEEICKAFAEVLKTDSVGRDSSFFTLGGTSFLAMYLISRLRERIGRPYSVRDVFSHPTPRMLALIHPSKQEERQTRQAWSEEASSVLPELRLLAAVKNTEAILPADHFTNYFLVARHLRTGNREGEVRIRTVLRCVWSREEFRNRAERLTANHPALRSDFVLAGDGRFWQVIERQKEPTVFYKDLSSLPEDAQERFINGFWQVLDQENALFSLALFPLSATHSVLLIHADHSVVDGVSTAVIQRELTAENYQSLPCDSYIVNRKNYLAATAELSEEARRYYSHLTLPEAHDSVKSTQGVRFSVEYVALSKDETGRLQMACANAGCSVFTWMFLCHARAVMTLKNTEEIWLRSIDHGRLELKEEEMRIVGNLAAIKPVRVPRTMTATELQDVFLQMQGWTGVVDTPFFRNIDLRKMPQGIVSADFGEMSPVIEESRDLLAEDQAAGPRLYRRNGQLQVRFCYEASQKEEHDRLIRQFREELGNTISLEILTGGPYEAGEL